MATPKKPSADYDTVTIDLGDKTYVLTPTLRAATNLTRYFGNFSIAFNRLGALDFDAVVSVIREGISSDGADAKRLPERIFQHGITGLVGPCSEYISLLLNGGRKPDDEDGSGLDEESVSKNL